MCSAASPVTASRPAPRRPTLSAAARAFAVAGAIALGLAAAGPRAQEAEDARHSERAARPAARLELSDAQLRALREAQRAPAGSETGAAPPPASAREAQSSRTERGSGQTPATGAAASAAPRFEVSAKAVLEERATAIVLPEEGRTARLEKVTAANRQDVLNEAIGVLERTGTAARRVSLDTGMAAFELPVSLRVPAGGEAGGEWRLQPVVQVAKALAYDEASRRFRGEVLVGVIDPAKPENPKELPFALQIALASDTLQEFRSLVTLQRAAQFEAVPVADRDPAEPSRLRFMVAGDIESSSTVDLPVVRPGIEVHVGDLMGLGLEAETVTISTTGLADPESVSLAVLAQRGRIVDPTVTLDANGLATTKLRSAGLGTDRVTVSGGPFEPTTVDVRVTAPWPFLLAALLGAGLGVVITREGRSHPIGSTLTALGTGVAVAVLYAIGVNLLAYQPAATAGEALTFGVALLGAVAGTRLFGRKESVSGDTPGP